MTGPTYEDVVADVPRDRWSRPLVIPPGGGKPVPYTRCTTYVGVLEDTYNLTKWKQRTVARGLSQRPDLLLRIASLGPQPDDETAAKQWKSRMDEVCESAMEAAGASAAATIGTSLHALTDRLDRGLPLGVVPEQYQPHLKAYEEATADLTAVHIERFTVYDQLQIGGTPDRILQVDGHDKLIIGDTKSGKNLEFGMGKIAMQLAVYAHSQLYNPTTGGRVPIGDVDTDRGLVIALNANTGTCELVWIDIAAGWQAVRLAKEVREWRARKGLSEPYKSVKPATPPVLQLNAKSALLAAIPVCNTEDELVQLWRAAGPAWGPQHTSLAAQRRAELQRQAALVG